MSDLSNARESFMQSAIALALESVASGGGPFGSVIVRDGAIVGRGQNRVTQQHDPTAHAEVLAIRDACQTLASFTLSGCELFTSCEPCPMCLGAILWARIDRVWYAATRHDAASAGFDDSQFYHEVLRPIDQRELPMRPLLNERAHAAFDAWDQAADRTLY